MKFKSRRRTYRKKLAVVKVRRTRRVYRRRTRSKFKFGSPNFQRHRRRVLYTTVSSWVANTGFISGATITAPNVLASALSLIVGRSAYEFVRLRGFKVSADGVYPVDSISALAVHSLTVDYSGQLQPFAPSSSYLPQIAQQTPGTRIDRGTRSISIWYDAQKILGDRAYPNYWLRLNNLGTPLDALPDNLGGVRYCYYGQSTDAAPPATAQIKSGAEKPNISVTAYLEFKTLRRTLQGEV